MNIEELAGIINKEVEGQESGEIPTKTRRKEELYTLVMMLECADNGGSDFVKLIDPFGEYSLNRAEAITYMMHTLKVKTIDDLTKWAGLVHSYAEAMSEKFKNGRNSKIFSSLLEIKTRDAKTRNMHQYFTNLAAIYCFIKICPEFSFDGNMLKYIENIHPYHINRLMKNVAESIANYGIPNTKTADRKDSSTGAEELELRLVNLQNTLDRANAKAEMYKEELNNIRASAENDAMIKIFARMNSRDAGRLMDQFASACSYIDTLEAEGHEIPAELRSLAVCVRMFVNFLHDSGVNMIKHVGETLSINLEESEEYDYTGSDFADENERKTVRVRTPGWSYMGTVFSVPGVYEYKEVTARP